jgi:N-acetylglucosamine-6-phosphate deacetylase
MCNTELTIQRDGRGQVKHVAGPGLVDIQVNGYAGVDFCGDPQALTAQSVGRACQVMRRRGVTAFLATIITDSLDMVRARLVRLLELRRQDELIARMMPAFHLEGLFISPEDGPRGAHPKAHVLLPKDHPHLLEQLQELCGGLLRYVTLAPESDGAIDMISRASRSGIRVGLGHHMADGRVLAEAVAAGAIISTHLGNGSHALLPRHQNYIQAQLAQDRLWASFIADGHHIYFPALKNFLRAKRAEKSILVTDAMSASDMPPGDYALGATRVQVGQDRKVCLADTPYLAGSALTLDEAVLNVVRHCDVSFESAWAMASTQPAELMGLAPPERIEVEVTDQGFARSS